MIENFKITPKETLEEAARDYIKGDDLSTFSQRAFFMAGAKWQQEQSNIDLIFKRVGEKRKEKDLTQKTLFEDGM